MWHYVIGAVVGLTALAVAFGEEEEQPKSKPKPTPPPKPKPTPPPKPKYQHVAVLGSTATGKTTFLKFLETGRILKDYAPTQSMGKTIEVRYKNMNLSANDVSGVIKDSKKVWLSLIEKSEHIIYIMDINKLLNDDQKQKEIVKSDIGEICETIRNRKNAKISLVANHSDKQTLYKDNYSNFIDKVDRLPIIMESLLKLGGDNKVKLVVGSLSDEIEAKKLTEKIFLDF